MSKFIPQCKAKDLKNVAKSKLLQKGWHATIKHDGNYVQIHKFGLKVQFFTSGGKEFHLPNAAELICATNPDVNFIAETEYMYKCDGKLGDRPKSARLTTYRTAFNKGKAVEDNPSHDRFVMFDLLHYGYDVKVKAPNLVRLGSRYLVRRSLMHLLEASPTLRHISTLYPDGSSLGCSTTLDEVKVLAASKRAEGWEGVVVKHGDHVQEPGKRANLAIKLKSRPTKELRCIGTTAGEGKYVGMIGALILQDETGIEVQVGSGMTDADRLLPREYYTGKDIEISYEQIMATYIQPIYIGVRTDASR